MLAELILPLLGVAFVLHTLYFYLYKRHQYPPGPFPYPLIGNLPSFIWNTFQPNQEALFRELSRQHGPVVTTWALMKPIVWVLDYKECVEWFVKNGDQFSERMSDKNFETLTRGGEYGVLATNGDLWKEQRRFALKTLRDFGLGKNQMQERILGEVGNLYTRVDKAIKLEPELEIHKFTDLAVGSVINAIICGYRFTDDGRDGEYYRLKDLLKATAKAFQNPLAVIAMIFPSFQRFGPFQRRFEAAINIFKNIFSFLDKMIEEHEKANDYTTMEEPHDFVDAFFIEWRRREAEKKESGVEHHFSRLQLLSVCADFWTAGQETSSTTISWAIALLISHPEVQKRLQEEFDSVIGGERSIVVADRPELPYLMAVITEVQRWANVISNNNLPRQTAEDVHIGEFHVPKGTMLFPMIAAVMVDERVFPDPYEFRPERFLDSNGHFAPKEEVIPFGIGRRQCPGEGLARMELYLFIANLFNRYSFSVGKTPIDLKKDYLSGIAVSPKAFSCVVRRRNGDDE